MKQILISITLTFIMVTETNAQFVKEMRNGLTSRVLCSCSDSSGNVYAVRYTDSIYVQKWDLTTRRWSRYTALSATLADMQASCNFLYNDFYLTGINKAGSYSSLYKYANGSWSPVGSIQYYNQNMPVRCVKFHNNLYFTGGIDSIKGVYSDKNVLVFDGTKFAQNIFPSNYWSATANFGSNVIKSDTMYIISDNQILYHVFPKIWGTYYTSGSNLNSIATANNGLYASLQNSNRIVKVATGIPAQNYSSGNTTIAELYGFNNTILVRPVPNVKIPIMKHINDTVSNAKNTFRNQLPDSNRRTSFITGGDATSSHLYYFGQGGVKINGRDYHYIAELFPDSFKNVSLDTVFVKAFADRNHDYTIQNGIDSMASGTIMTWTEMQQNDTADQSGLVEFHPLDNEICNVRFVSNNAPLDSCYRPPFSGTLASATYNSHFTRDLVYYPLWPTSAYNRNLVVKSWSVTQSKARLLDDIPLNVDIYNYDCGTSTANVTLVVTLHPKTVFVSSVPAPNTVSGNTLTYNLANLPANVVNHIKLKIKYPNTDFNIGDMVKHYVKITPGFSEDPGDNNDSIVQKLVYSYDPNAKNSEPEGHITTGLKNVRYFIHFQNEGNDDAIRVTVVDTLIKGIPVYEFRMVDASHPYTVSLSGNVVTWIFDDINLAPKAENEDASKGYIIFDAKVKSELRVGDSIRNKAYIYFDYNSPIITNFAVILRDEDHSGIDPPVPGYQYLKAYPNPASHYVTLANTGSKTQQVTIYDIKGAKISSVVVHGNDSMIINTDSWAKGLYLCVGERAQALKILIE